jgi:hypothetical protein
MLSHIAADFSQLSEQIVSGNRSKVRPLFILLSAMFASPVIAADFRGSELGGPCSSISEHELALGSKELGDPSLVDQHRFSGHAFSRDVVLGDLHTAQHDYDEAALDFDAVYTGLTAIYGAPFIEHSSDQKISEDAQLPRVRSEPRAYQAAWKGDGFHASLALHAADDRTGPKWLVVVILTP